jgi:hypothetical protein
MIFRLDDICLNSDMTEVNEVTDYLLTKGKVIWAVSPIVHDIDNQRVFPAILTAMSDVRNFYLADKLGVPQLRDDVQIASHGLIHADHRLLSKEVQELSIVLSCSVLKTKTFVPPFNKWNSDTQEICRRHGIELVKFEDGWLSMEHNDKMEGHEKWYLHHWKFNLNKIKEWITF